MGGRWGIALIGALLVAACGSGSVNLAAVRPCEVLDGAQRAELGLAWAASTPEYLDDPRRTCRYSTSGNPGAPYVALSVHPGGTLNEWRVTYAGSGRLLMDAEVASRPALVSTGPACAVAVDVGSGLLLASGGEDCPAVRRMAEIAVTNLTA